jgi:cytochrome c oxidase cbb3-type subunit 3
MSGFWSAWVVCLVVLNLGVALFLFIFGQRVRIPTEPDGTTGHAWAHGVLREGVRRLPLWWLVISAVGFVVAIAYLALYPAMGSYPGLLGWTSAAEHERNAAADAARLERVLASLDARDLEAVAPGDAAALLGRRLYLDNCAACHGMEAKGNAALGAPNLTDSVWLYGGGPDAVVASILGGRRGTMPAWGAALGHDGVVDVASYVRSLAGFAAPPGWAAAGKARFETMCAACHGIGGKGMQALGAPDLTDSDWLYGSDLASVMASVRDGRSGEMPAWRGRLRDDEARAIAAWLYSQRKRVRPALTGVASSATPAAAGH